MKSNVDRLRDAIEHFEAGDLEKWLEDFDDDVLWFPVDLPDIEVVRGKVAVLDLMQSYLEPWDSVEFETLAIEAHGDSVVWVSKQTVTQSSTDLTFSEPLSAVFDYRDGVFVEVHWFWGADAAREWLSER